MYLYAHSFTDPYFNLALEEYLLRHTGHNFLLLWRSIPSVVVGKHQNLHAELRQKQLVELGIVPARRLSGGGTVFHDLGNLNFSFIKAGTPGRLVDFRQFIGPIAEFLQSLGVPAQLSERNDILIDGLKVSGNAEHVYKNRVLHHGTLLFDSRLDWLGRVLRPATEQFRGRAIASVRRPVTQIGRYLAHHTIESFTQALIEFALERFECRPWQATQQQLSDVATLAQEKYAQPEWVFDYSPTYQQQVRWLEQSLWLTIERGHVQRIEPSDGPSPAMLDALLGKRMELGTVTQTLAKLGVQNQLEAWFD